MLRRTVLTLMLAAFALAPATASAQVGLNLSLVVDVSGSVDNTDFNLQKSGYVNAFNSAALWNAIAASQGGAIAVNYIQFASTATQMIGWTLINSQAAAQNFATAIDNAGRAGGVGGATGIGEGLQLARNTLAAPTYTAPRAVIDVSGDGCNNTGTSPANQRNLAQAAGITINGLTIADPPFFTSADLANCYNAEVVTNDGFIVSASGFNDFETAIQDKLIKEISGVPEPSTIILLGTGLLGLGGVGLRRRRQQDDEQV